MLAALVVMAIVIPVAIEGLRIANRAGVVAQRKGVAVQLADQLLNELIVTGGWQDAQRRGTFGEEFPGYRWEMLSENWGKEALRLISVEVAYEVQNREYNVRLSTLVPPANQ